MFGFDPFSRPVAIAEMLLLLALPAFLGWVIARLILNSRVSALKADIALKEVELDNCRRAKSVMPPVNTIRNEVRSDIRNEVTASAFIGESLVVPVIAAPMLEVPVMAAPVLEVPVMAAPMLEVPVMAASVLEVPVAIAPTIVATMAPSVAKPLPLATPTVAVMSTEDAVLNRIASRVNEINFDRIGRASAAEADDLKDIVGVGPFLERKLHSLGIYTFRQVGNFIKEDIDKVNDIIEFFPGRIGRDNWVGQSAAFYEQKYGRKLTE